MSSKATSTPAAKLISRGQTMHSSAALFHIKGRWRRKAKPAKKEKKKVTIPKRGAPSYYPTEYSCRPLLSRKSNLHKPTIRKSIRPGVVLVLLVGRFRGKRVVCLGTLPSGMVVVTGPYKVNGVPLRRVNPVYVIATSTRLDALKGFKLPAAVNDDFFSRPLLPKINKSEMQFFEGGKDLKKKSLIPKERLDLQKTVDAQILTAIKATPMLGKYMSSRFSLTSGQLPHAMKF